MLVEAAFTAAIVLFTSVCLVTDVRSRRIPNWLTVSALGVGLVAQTLVSGWPGLQASLGGFAAGFGILFVLWLLGGGGGGDVKMMSALGAWLGASLTIEVFLASAVVTILIVALAMFRGGLPKKGALPKGADGKAGKSAAGKETKKARPGRIVPYAVPLALGTWAVIVFESWRTGGFVFWRTGGWF